MSTTTVNMSLTVPTVGDSDYPTSISDSLTVIDSHTHAAGSGVQIPTGGIANLAVTRVKQAAVGQQVSASSGAYSNISTTVVDVTNLTVTITTTGRPVMIGLMPDSSATISYLSITRGPGLTGPFHADFYLMEDVTIVGRFGLGSTLNYVTPPALAEEVTIPPSSVSMIRAVAAGTYTYKIQTLVDVLGAVGYVNFVKLYAYEL